MKSFFPFKLSWTVLSLSMKSETKQILMTSHLLHRQNWEGVLLFLLYKCSFTKWCCFEPWRERRNSGRPGGSKKSQHHRKKGAQQRRSRSVRQCSRFRRMKRRIRHSQDMSRKGSSRSKLWTVEFRFSKKLVRILGTSPWRVYWLEIASGMSLLNTSKLDFSNNQHLLSRVFSPICWRARSDLSTHESRQPTSVLLKSVREQ